MASALIARCLQKKRLGFLVFGWGFLVITAVVLVALGSTRSVQPQSDQQSSPSPTTTQPQPDQPQPAQPESTQPRPESPCELETVVPQDQEALKADCEALWEFFTNLDGRGILDDPDRSDAWGWNTPLHEWHGVYVGDNRVETIFLLTGTGLAGSTSKTLPSLAKLTNLWWMEIEGSELSGPIPPEIGDLNSLRAISLSSNELSGPIPPEVGELTNLIALNLGHNRLTGHIPFELAKLTNLEYLSLHENYLEGSIPPELGQLTNLRKLHLFNNRLTGVVPEEINQIPNLEILSVEGNSLSVEGNSEPPCELEVVVPQDQEELKADCEALWEFFTNLDERGILDDPDSPDAWGRNTPLHEWHGIAVVNNRVEELFLLTHTGSSGSISESIPLLSRLDSLRWLEIEGFGSGGPIPPEIGDFFNLRGLSLLGNNLSGSIPPEVGRLTNLIALNFGYNNLTGLIPPELARLSNLEYLLLHENHLEILIPPELSQLTNLRELYLSKID